MEGMRGLQHKTSIQLAQEQRISGNSGKIAGQKRSWSSVENNSTNLHHGREETVRFQRAISLPPEPERLRASSIVKSMRPTAPSEYSQRRLIAATPTSTQDPERVLGTEYMGFPTSSLRTSHLWASSRYIPGRRAVCKTPACWLDQKILYIVLQQVVGNRWLQIVCLSPGFADHEQGADIMSSAHAKTNHG